MGFAFQTAGLVTTTASKSGLITGLYVVLTPLIAGAVARRAPRSVTVVGAGLAFVGLALLTSPGNGFTDLVVGDTLTVGAAFGFAGHIVVLATSAPRHPVIRFTAAQMSVVAALALISSFFVEGLPTPRTSDLPALAATGVADQRGRLPHADLGPDQDRSEPDRRRCSPSNRSLPPSPEWSCSASASTDAGGREPLPSWVPSTWWCFGTSRELAVAESIRHGVTTL